MSELAEHTTPEKLHVLWHNFEPSQRLSEAVREFTGSAIRLGFLLRSTRQVYVDGVAHAHSEYHAEEAFARDIINDARGRQFIIGNMQAKLLHAPNNASEAIADRFRIAFQTIPEQQEALNLLESSLDIFPAAVARGGIANHFLYVDVAPESILWRGDMDEAYGQLKKTIAENVHKRLFSAAVVGITGLDISASNLPPQQTPPQRVSPPKISRPAPRSPRDSRYWQ